MPDTDIERNAALTSRLRELTASLTPDDLARSLGGGWTVAVALVHLAFWDVRQHAALREFATTGALAGDASDDAVNGGLERVAQRVDPAAAAGLAIEAAEAVDATIAGLDAGLRAPLLGGEDAYMIRRWAHREEHLEQIEAGLRA